MGPMIAALSRTGFKDVDRAWEAVRHAEKPRIHVFIATSPIHMKKKLRMTEDEVKAEVVAGRGPRRGLHVRRRVLAGGRQPVRRRLHVRRAAVAVDNGATTLNIPDTVGLRGAGGVRRS